MKRFAFIASITIALATASTAFSANANVEDFRKQLAEVRLMRSTLAESDLSDFLGIAATNGWAAPWIHSVSWVAWLPKVSRERVLFEQEKRDLGRDLLTQVDCEAFRILDPADSKVRKAQIELLFRFSSWIGQSRGYGNFALMMRTENLACIPIGHLAVDLDWVLEDVEALVAQFTPLNERLTFQVDVLNEEAPHKFLFPDVNDWENDLDIQWQKRLAPACRQFEKQTKKPPPPYNLKEVEGMAHVYSFYFDDQRNNEPFSLSEWWNSKRHFRICIRGCTDTIRWKVDKTLLFRKMLGRFPLKPVHSRGRFDSEIREAFYEAWEPHMREHGKAASSTAFVYAATRDNSFMDYDTQCLIRFLGMSAPAVETNSVSTPLSPVSEALIVKYQKWRADGNGQTQ